MPSSRMQNTPPMQGVLRANNHLHVTIMKNITKLSEDLHCPREEYHESTQLRSRNHKVSHLQCVNPSHTISHVQIHHGPSTPCTPNLTKHPQTWCTHFRCNLENYHSLFTRKVFSPTAINFFCISIKPTTCKFVPIAIPESNIVS
jgi:hypothetical protein